MKALSLLAVLLLPSLAAAQTPILSGVQYAVQADYTDDKAVLSWFTLRIDGEKYGDHKLVQDMVVDSITFDDVLFAPGQRSITVCAANDFGENCSEPLVVDVLAAAPAVPGMPSKPRLILKVELAVP